MRHYLRGVNGSVCNMRKLKTHLLTISLLAFLSGFSWAQADDRPDVVEPKPDTFFEKYDETVDVAGQLRAGLMYRSTLETVDINDLRMDLKLQLVKSGETACIRVASRNGVFSATWEIALETNVSEQVITNFPTRYKKYLEKLHPDELVAIASVVDPGQTCSSQRTRYLPTSWGKLDKTNIVVYLNADSTDALIAGRINKETTKGKCRILPSSEDNTSFDTICTLPTDIANIENDANIELIVVRKNFSTVMKKIRYQLSGT